MGPRHLEAGEEAVVLLLLEGVEEGVGHLLLEVEADRVAVGDLEEREGEARHPPRPVRPNRGSTTP